MRNLNKWERRIIKEMKLYLLILDEHAFLWWRCTYPLIPQVNNHILPYKKSIIKRKKKKNIKNIWGTRSKFIY